MSDADNPLPRFFELLDQAHSSSDEVDAFDLNSNDPKSVSEFGDLVRQETDDINALIDYIKEHGDHIKRRHDIV